jgi:hypothetical protein
LYVPFLSSIRATCPAHFSLLDHPKNTWWGLQITDSSLCGLPHYPVALLPRPSLFQISSEHTILENPEPAFFPQSTELTNIYLAGRETSSSKFVIKLRHRL